MSFELGTFTQWDDANSIMDPQILIPAKAINLGLNKGAFYQSLGAPISPIKDVEFEIFNRSSTAKSGTVGDGEGTGWDASATADLPVSSAFADGVTVGHVLKIGSEVVVVKSVDRSADTIDVWSRGVGATTGAIHADTTAIAVIGFAGKDSDLKNVESVSETTKKYTNYCQTIFETLDWEFMAVNLKRQGLNPDQIKAVLMNEAMIRVAKNLAVMSVLGIKQAGSKNSNPYMTAGVIEQLLDTASSTRPILSYAVSGSLTEAKLRAGLQEVFQVGSPDTIWCSPANKEIINGFAGSPTTVQLQRQAESTEAGTHVATYNYEGAILNVKVDADMPKAYVPIVNSAKCTKGWLEGDGLRAEMEPETSSREKRESIQGSVGIAIEDVGYEHTILTAIS